MLREPERESYRRTDRRGGPIQSGYGCIPVPIFRALWPCDRWLGWFRAAILTLATRYGYSSLCSGLIVVWAVGHCRAEDGLLYLREGSTTRIMNESGLGAGRPCWLGANSAVGR